jgi:hypothetical protein
MSILLEPITETAVTFAGLIDDVCVQALKCLGLLAIRYSATCSLRFISHLYQSFKDITIHIKEALEQLLLAPAAVFFHLRDPDARESLQKAIISTYITCQCVNPFILPRSKVLSGNIFLQCRFLTKTWTLPQ